MNKHWLLERCRLMARGRGNPQLLEQLVDAAIKHNIRVKPEVLVGWSMDTRPGAVKAFVNSSLFPWWKKILLRSILRVQRWLKVGHFAPR